MWKPTTVSHLMQPKVLKMCSLAATPLSVQVIGPTALSLCELGSGTADESSGDAHANMPI